MPYQISYRCIECEQPSFIGLYQFFIKITFLDSLDIFERHVWTYHINDFAYHCAFCGLPALNIGSLNDHFAQQHDQLVNFIIN